MKSIIVVQIVFGLVSFTLQVDPSESALEVRAFDSSSQVVESNDQEKAPPELASVDSNQETVQAEVAATESAFEPLRTEEKPVGTQSDVQNEKKRIQVLPSESSSPLLNDDAPTWVRVGISQEGDELRFPVETSLHSTIEECREELDDVLLSEVSKFLEKNVLKNDVSVGQLEGFTLAYIKEKLLVPEREFLNVVDRPSGSYQQLWRQIYISKSELATIQGWEKNYLVRERTTEVGFMGGSALLGMTLLSGLVGLLAKREKAKLKG